MSAAQAIPTSVQYSNSKPVSASKSRASKTVSAGEIQKVVSTLQLATSSTRMMILLELAEGDRYAGELREALNNSSQPSVSHQLSLLRHGRLVEANREGRKIRYQLSPLGSMIVQALDRLDS